MLLKIYIYRECTESLESILVRRYVPFSTFLGENLFAVFSAVILSISFSVAIYRFFSIQVTNIAA